jgi:ribose-phosphate pyrophosphokinase
MVKNIKTRPHQKPPPQKAHGNKPEPARPIWQNPFLWLVLVPTLLYAKIILFDFTALDDQFFVIEHAAFNENLGNLLNVFSQGLFVPKNGNDLLRVFLATDAIRQLKKEAKIWLFLPFVPFARQDRVCEPGEPLSVKVFADMLNNQKYDRVFVYDPHSDVAPALINNCCVIKNHQFVREVRAEILGNAKSYSDLLFISPDAGSYKKIFNTVKELHHTGKIVICDKVRDTATGQIIQTTVNTDDLEGKDVLIVDDICDGGRTFIEIAKELRKRNAGHVFLAVTFGIFSNGFDDLLQWFDRIYCTNLLKDVDYGYITVIPVELTTSNDFGLITV